MKKVAQEYEILKREVPYQGIFRIARYQLRYQLLSDQSHSKWSEIMVREVLERQSAACVLPFDPILDQVILIEQFRPGALFSERVKIPWLIEIVAGIFDQDETPAQVAQREAIEEADCELLDLYPVYEYFVSPGGSNEYCHLFCGKIDANDFLKQPNHSKICGLDEENENIRAFALPSEEVFALLRQGKIQTAPAIIALQWLQLNREWLKQLWQK